ncbi:MAG TPA: hypothetical protein VKP08_12710, partial [Anaerolineales bacterium]|nr:hypothetical protein [Anaerolineales bacterium]
MEQHLKIILLMSALFLTAIACSLGQNPTPTASPATGSAPVIPATTQPNLSPSGNVITPDNLEYLGAFRLPGGDEPPQTFAYGGNAMTFNP